MADQMQQGRQGNNVVSQPETENATALVHFHVEVVTAPKQLQTDDRKTRHCFGMFGSLADIGSRKIFQNTSLDQARQQRSLLD